MTGLQKISNILLLQRPWFGRVVVGIYIITIAIAIGFPLYIYAVISNPYNLFGAMPALRTIENPAHDFSSEVISADGVSLGRYFRYNRSQITYDQLSPYLVETLVISEDHRFFQHSGMDAQAFLRVIAGMISLNSQGGGSTLTQQTAKNLFRTREEELQGKIAKFAWPLKLLISKTKEWIIAVKLEQNFTKEEIIALYFNTVPFNNNAFGIQIAAETYFQKHPRQLNIQESALLVGMLQGTALYNPVTHPERALRKRNDVLSKLLKHQYIKTKKESDSLKALPLQLNFSVQNANEGLAAYFRNVLGLELLSWCKVNNVDLYESGLKIHTTIDSRLQRFAEDAVAEHMSQLQKNFERDWGIRNPWVDDNNVEIKDFLTRKIKRTDTYKNLVLRYGKDSDSINIKLHEKRPMKVFSWTGDRDTLFSSFDSLQYYNRFLQSGLIAIDSKTGAVKAWSGGIDYTYFKYDHVKQSTRQAGSTFKPFVYGLAMENGYSPCQRFYDIAPSINVNSTMYHPRNSNGTYGDGNLYTLRQAMARSLNSITLQLMEKLDPKNVMEFSQRLGITTRLDPVYSLALGTSDVSLYEITGAYTSFVNLGVYTRPYYVTRIEDRNGNILQNFIPVTKQVMDEETAYKMVHIFRGGVEEPGGTSQNLSEAVKKDNEVGGKTGTTDNGSDGWYIGITNNLVTGVWVGGDERNIHFPRWGEGSGGRAALPIWNKFMTSVYKHPECGYVKEQFRTPALSHLILNCDVQYDSALGLP